MGKSSLGLLNSAVYFDLLLVSKVCTEQAKEIFKRDAVKGLVSGVRNPMSLDNWPDGEDLNAFYLNDTEGGRIDRPFQDLLVADISGAPWEDYDHFGTEADFDDYGTGADLADDSFKIPDEELPRPFIKCRPNVRKRRYEDGSQWKEVRWPDGNCCATKMLRR